MSQVMVSIVNSAAEAASHLAELFGSVRDRIRERFAKRSGEIGRDLEDWFTAERELLYSPLADLVETDEEFRVRATVPGFPAESLQLNVLPDSIIIEGRHEEGAESESGKVHLREFGLRTLVRKLDLPGEIDPEHVHATLDHGVLVIRARKAQPAVKPQVQEQKVRHQAA
jgi:HSP20 family protein